MKDQPGSPESRQTRWIGAAILALLVILVGTARNMRAGITPDGTRLLYVVLQSRQKRLGMIDIIRHQPMWQTRGGANVYEAWRPFSDDGSQFLADLAYYFQTGKYLVIEQLKVK